MKLLTKYQEASDINSVKLPAPWVLLSWKTWLSS